MTDKVQKIREGVERLKSQLLRGACSSQIAMETMCKEEAYNEVLAILDTMQEEPKHRFNVGDKVQSVSGKIAKIESVDTDKYWCIGEQGMSIPFKYQDQWELVEEPEQCMYSKDNYTEEDRKVLCEGCEEKCEFNQVKESAILQHKEETCKENGDPLTQEPVSEDLEKAANEWNAKALDTPFYMTLDDNGNPNGVRQDYTTHAESFKAGAEWQKQKDDEEKVLIYKHGFDDCKEQMMAELQAKDSMPVSDELEKVAELYTLDDKIKPWRNLTKEAFIAGAKWKKEQMMAKAINTEASLTLSVPSICISLPHGVNVGDKVKVIVIKEE